MFWKLFGRKIKHADPLFIGHFIEAKAFYVSTFNKIPCVSFIGELDTTKVFKYIDECYTHQIKAIYQHAYYEHTDKRMLFNNTIFVLNDNRMLELGSNYCQVLHTPQQYNWANVLITNLAAFKQEVVPAKDNRVIGFAQQNAMN
jgi:hypothetical protein